MSLKKKLTNIIERLDALSSVAQKNAKNEELQNIYDYMLLVQDDNEEPLFIEEELKNLFTENEETNYTSSVTSLILVEDMSNSNIRLLKKILKDIRNKL